MTTWFIWAQFRWNWTNLKIWPLYKRSMTFCCFGLYLENETSYGFHVIDFFAPYDPRKNLICITTKLNHFHYSTNLEDRWSLTPCNDPPCSWFWMVSTLGMLLIVYRIHPYRTRFYILIMQLAIKYGVLPPRYYVLCIQWNAMYFMQRYECSVIKRDTIMYNEAVIFHIKINIQTKQQQQNKKSNSKQTNNNNIQRKKINQIRRFV